MENTVKRLSFLDIAKGIAIIAVVVGHSDSISQNSTVINSYIYTFHMPIFFVISGYLFSRKKNTTDFLKSKIRSTMLPYAFIFLLTVIFNGLIKCSYYDFSAGRGETIKTIVISFLYGVGLPMFDGKVQTTGPLWFLPCLLLANIIFYLVITLIEKYFNNNVCWQIVIVTAVTFIGVMCQRYYKILPFSLDIALFCQIYMYVGFILKKYQIIEKGKYNIPLLILTLAGYIYVAATYQGISLNNRQFGNYFTSLTGALCGSIAVMIISRYIDKLVIISSCMEFLGNISIVILCFHIMDCTLLSLDKLEIFSPIYQSTLLLVLFRIAISIAVYLIIAVTPLYRIFFKAKPKRILINSFSKRIEAVKMSRKYGNKNGQEELLL